jgi:phytoene synthase
MTRKTSFYYSFLVLPARERGAITAVFDFCRVVDDAVDLEPDPVRAAAALDTWRAELDRIFTDEPPRTPQGRALQPYVGPFNLPRREFEALIAGVGMDITPSEFQTFSDLEPYCHRVASAVGLICAEIFGYQDPSVRAYARDLGVALQLTNILRDVAVDFRNGRLYLPIEDLERCGCDRRAIQREVEHAGHGVQSPQVRRVLEMQAARARAFFSRAEAALPARDAKRMLPAEIMRAVYWEVLRRIEAAQFDVFSTVIRVTRPVQARIALGEWWKARRA